MKLILIFPFKFLDYNLEFCPSVMITIPLQMNMYSYTEFVLRNPFIYEHESFIVLITYVWRSSF